MQQNAFSQAFSNFKKVQKQTCSIIKTKDNIMGLLQKQRYYSRSGKDTSSIKSIIKRLQQHGNIKINYSKIRSRNDRPDIFLQGGQINNIKQIKFLQTEEEKQLQRTQKKVQQRKSVFQMSKSNKNFISAKCNNKSKKNAERQKYKTGSQKFCKTQTQQHFKDKDPENQDYKIILQSKTNKTLTLQKHKKTQRDWKNTKTLNIKDHLKLKSTSSNFLQNYSTQKNQAVRPLFYLSQKEIQNITAQSFIVSQYPSGRIITGNKFKQVCQIASLTKIVTFYVCLRLIQIYHLDIDKQQVIIDEYIQLTSGTTAQLLQGDQFTIRTLFYGLMLPSGNDAALALAKWGGGILLKQNYSNDKPLQKFMKFMNQECQKIQMKSSYFGNPHGLPHSKNGTTAQDVAVLINKALQYQLFKEIIKSKFHKCWVKNGQVTRQVVWENTNKLLRRKGFIGVKTGVTVTAGPCLATCYQSGDKIYIIVVLGTTKLSRRFKQTRMIVGKVLWRLRGNKYSNQIKQIQRNNSDLDSDNSQDQQQFNYQRKDLFEMQKRMKIIVNQM